MKRINNNDLTTWVYNADSKIHGTGAFANKKIKEGEYIGTYHGPKTQQNDTYVLWIYDLDDEESAQGIDGQNLLRYLNHSTQPNCEFNELDLYALQDIEKGQELTFDYGEDPA